MLDEVSRDDYVSSIARRAARQSLQEVVAAIRAVRVASVGGDLRMLDLQQRSVHALAVLSVFRDFFPPKGMRKMTHRVARVERLAGRAWELTQLLHRDPALRAPSAATGPPSADTRPVVDTEQGDGPARESAAEGSLPPSSGNAPPNDTLGDDVARIVAQTRLSFHRQLALQELAKTAERWNRRQIERRIAKLAHRAVYRPPGVEPRYGALAVAQLDRACQSFAQAAGADLSEVALLYDLADTARRLGVQLEIFQPLLPQRSVLAVQRQLAEVIAELEPVLLHAVAQSWFTRWGYESSTRQERNAFEMLNEWEKRQLPLQYERFRNWWSDERAQVIVTECSNALATLRQDH